MNLADNQLEEISNYAALLFTPKEICCVLELNYEDMGTFFRAEDSPIYKAYYKGHYLAKAKQRKQVFDCADAGSAQAQQQVESYFEQWIVESNKA